jgi:hypothetical protein
MPDDASSHRGLFCRNLLLLREAEGNRAMYGYFPEGSKSILAICRHNLEAAKMHFASQQFKITTGERYLGGYIGAKEEQNKWIKEKVVGWAVVVSELAKVAVRYPVSVCRTAEVSATCACGSRESHLG